MKQPTKSQKVQELSVEEPAKDSMAAIISANRKSLSASKRWTQDDILEMFRANPEF